MGTPLFSAPEVLADNHFSEKSDAWAVGVILHQLCCLELPFTGKSYRRIIRAIKEENPKPIPSQYSRELQTAISRLLTKAPAQRASARDILEMPLIRDFMQLTASTNSARLSKKSCEFAISQKSLQDDFDNCRVYENSNFMASELMNPFEQSGFWGSHSHNSGINESLIIQKKDDQSLGNQLKQDDIAWLRERMSVAGPIRPILLNTGSLESAELGRSQQVSGDQSTKGSNKHLEDLEDLENLDGENGSKTNIPGPICRPIRASSMVVGALDESSILFQSKITAPSNSEVVIELSKLKESLGLQSKSSQNRRQTLQIFEMNRQIAKAEKQRLQEEVGSGSKNNQKAKQLIDAQNQEDGEDSEIGSAEKRYKPMKLGFLEMHLSNIVGKEGEQATQEEPGDEESPIENKSPQICGKIGKRASRFSMYGQLPNLGLGKNSGKGEPNSERIVEVNESMTSDSRYSAVFKDNQRGSWHSDSHHSGSRLAHNAFSIDEDSVHDDDKLASSKQQERLLHKALQSDSKFSLDNLGVLKQSGFKQANYNSLVGTRFGKKAYLVPNLPISKAVGEPRNLKHRISIENQLSGFRPRYSRENTYPAKPVKQHIKKKRSESLTAHSPNDSPSNPAATGPLKLPLKTSYRDSCDNGKDHSSAVNFYEHWKLSNHCSGKEHSNQTTQWSKKGQGLNLSSKEENENQGKRQSSGLSLYSEDSNYYNIFAPKYDSLSHNGSTYSGPRSSYGSRNHFRQKILSVTTGKTESNVHSSLNRPNKQSQIRLSTKSQFRDWSRASEGSNIGATLLSDIFTRVEMKTGAQKAKAEVNQRDSMFSDSIGFELKPRAPKMVRNSEQFNGSGTRESKFIVDDLVKKKYSMINDQIHSVGTQKKRKPAHKHKEHIQEASVGLKECEKEALWEDVQSRFKLVNMLSASSDTLEGLESPDQIVAVLESKAGRGHERSDSARKTVARRTLESSGAKCKTSDADNEQKESVEPDGHLLRIPIEYNDIRDNKKSIFDVSKEPSEMTNYLSRRAERGCNFQKCSATSLWPEKSLPESPSISKIRFSKKSQRYTF